MHNTCLQHHHELKHGRRGMAMMLVIVALAVVTVSTTAYLASRANAPQIGNNVASGAIARIVAENGIDLATAIMRSDDVDWRTAHVNGVLIEDYDYGGGTLTVTVADLEGNIPTEDTEYVNLTATGNVDGMEQIAEAKVEATGTEAIADFDLSEFAIFASESIEVDNAMVGRWSLSPQASKGEPVRIGTNSADSGSISLLNDSALIDTIVYTREDASASLTSNLSNLDLALREESTTGSDLIPYPKTPLPKVMGFVLAEVQEPYLTSGAWICNNSKIFTSMHMDGPATLECIMPNTTVVIINDLLIESGAEFIINQQNTDVVVLGNVTVRGDAAISVQGSGSLRLFVGEDLLIDDATLALPRSIATNDSRDANRGVSSYYDPTLCKVFQLRVGDYLAAAEAAGWTKTDIPHDDAARKIWKLDHAAFTRGMFYGSNVDVQVTANSALFGNLVCSQVDLDGGSALHYDPCLDERMGYTNTASFLYTDEGSLNTDVLSMAVDLEDSTCLAVNNYVETDVAPTTTRDWRHFRRRWRRLGMMPRWDGDE